MVDTPQVPWLDEHIQLVEDIPRVDWEAVWKHLEDNVEEEKRDAVYSDVVEVWTDRLADSLGEGFAIHESDNFDIVTNLDDDYVARLAKSLEAARDNILTRLGDTAVDMGALVVVILEDEAQYYRYISYFYPEEGEFAASAGVFIARGHCHIALPALDLEYAKSVCVHELTHSFLGHLPIPMWLDEGITAVVEHEITGMNPVWVDDELMQRHRDFWPHENRIQEFWSGESFHRADEGSELSYHLARMAVHAMTNDDVSFRAFVLAANGENGGEAAAQEVLGGSLGGLIEHVIGPGDWAPHLEATDPSDDAPPP